jgi:hypothetical protein
LSKARYQGVKDPAPRGQEKTFSFVECKRLFEHQQAEIPVMQIMNARVQADKRKCCLCPASAAVCQSSRGNECR